MSRSEGAPYRYAILTREIVETSFNNIIRLMNCEANMESEYIKILISSRVGRDGINVNNVQQIHLIGLEWNQSSIYQAISRGVRVTSHNNLIEKYRAGNVTVNIFQHAGVPSDEELGCVDNEMYALSMEKDREIRRVLNMMKRCAVGCKIFYERNMAAKDLDYSQECDYNLCQYSCSEEGLNKHTLCFNVLQDSLENPENLEESIIRIIGNVKNVNTGRTHGGAECGQHGNIECTGEIHHPQIELQGQIWFQLLHCRGEGKLFFLKIHIYDAGGNLWRTDRRVLLKKHNLHSQKEYKGNCARKNEKSGRNRYGSHYCPGFGYSRTTHGHNGHED